MTLILIVAMFLILAAASQAFAVDSRVDPELRRDGFDGRMHARW